MVRLKGVDLDEILRNILFQFHMVRLKETMIQMTELYIIISIPHGTIKRKRLDALFGVNIDFNSTWYD